MPTTPEKPSQPSQPSQNKELTVSQKQKIEEWREKMKNDNEAIKEGRSFLNNIKPTFDPEETLKKIAREMYPKYRITNGAENEADTKLFTQAMYDFGLENGCSIADTIQERYRGMMANLRKEIIKEFNCQSYSEKALVDLMVSAYARNLTLGKMLINEATSGHTTPGLNNFMAIMSKGVDRANRHFLAALETLKSIKQPELKVNIKTNTAFVSQSQQFNNNNDKNETVEAK